MSKKFQMVLVEWLDSNELHGWQYGEYPAELAYCKSLGYIIDNTDEKLVLSQTISDYGAHMGITIIAKGCVKYIKELRIR